MARTDIDKIVKKRRKINQDTMWRVDMKEALAKRGIDKPFALWQKLGGLNGGGSHQTATDLFNGKVTMLRLETLDRLDAIGISPFEILTKEPKKDKADGE